MSKKKLPTIMGRDMKLKEQTEVLQPKLVYSLTTNGAKRYRIIGHSAGGTNMSVIVSAAVAAEFGKGTLVEAKARKPRKTCEEKFDECKAKSGGAKRGRKPKAGTAEEEVEDQVEDAVEEASKATKKLKRGKKATPEVKEAAEKLEEAADELAASVEDAPKKGAAKRGPKPGAKKGAAKGGAKAGAKAGAKKGAAKKGAAKGGKKKTTKK